MLFIETLLSYVVARKFQVHDFVVMPDHVHLLVTVRGDITTENAMQFIKGGFSDRLKKEFGVNWVIISDSAAAQRLESMGMTCIYQNSRVQVCRLQ